MPNVKLRDYTYAILRARAYGDIQVPILKTPEDFEFTNTAYIFVYGNTGYYMRIYGNSKNIPLTIGGNRATALYYSGNNCPGPLEDDNLFLVQIGGDSDLPYLYALRNSVAGGWPAYKGPPYRWRNSVFLHNNLKSTIVPSAQIGAGDTGAVYPLRGFSGQINNYWNNYYGTYPYYVLGMQVIVDGKGKCLPISCHWPISINVPMSGEYPEGNYSGIYTQTSDSVLTKVPTKDSFGMVTHLQAYGPPINTYAASSVQYVYSSQLDSWFTNSVIGQTGPSTPIDPDQPGEIEPEPDPDNPYKPGDGKPGGGNPGGSNPVEDIRISGLNRLFSAYVIDGANLSNFCRWMWTPNIFDQLARTYAEPIDLILGLYVLPYRPTVGPASEITFGNLKATGVTAYPVSDNYKILDFTAKEEIKYCLRDKDGVLVPSYLDYAPYTDVSIYLPWCGTVKLDTDVVMGKKVNVQYRIDVLTGSCLAHIIVDDNVYMYVNGNMHKEQPITNYSWGEYNRTMINSATSLAANYATGGIVSAGSKALQAGKISGDVIGPRTARGAFQSGSETGALAIGGSSLANSVTTSKVGVSISGNVGSSLGFLGPWKPFMLIKRPKPWVTETENKFLGFPSHIEKRLQEVKGYAIIEEIHLSITGATVEEINEIERLLKSGVYL